jgi:hypothetical protein
LEIIHTAIATESQAGGANVDFTRLPTNCTLGGMVYLEGLYPAYNPALHGTITVHDGNPAHDAVVDANGNRRMTVPEGPVNLSFSLPLGATVRYGFLNPYEVMDNYTTLHLFLDLTGAVSSVAFGTQGGTGDDAGGTVRIPVVLIWIQSPPDPCPIPASGPPADRWPPACREILFPLLGASALRCRRGWPKEANRPARPGPSTGGQAASPYPADRRSGRSGEPSG